LFREEASAEVSDHAVPRVREARGSREQGAGNRACWIILITG
jgi:hypothetical protein